MGLLSQLLLDAPTPSYPNSFNAGATVFAPPPSIPIHSRLTSFLDSDQTQTSSSSSSSRSLRIIQPQPFPRPRPTKTSFEDNSAVWPVKCEKKSEAGAEEELENAYEEQEKEKEILMGPAEPGPGGGKPKCNPGKKPKPKKGEEEPDNPSKFAVDTFAQETKNDAVNEMLGKKAKTRNYENELGSRAGGLDKKRRGRRMGGAEFKQAANDNAENDAKIIKETDYTIEKFVRGEKPWVADQKAKIAAAEMEKLPPCDNPVGRSIRFKSIIRSLDEFKQEQPLPLAKRMGEISTQAYYLWGLAHQIRSKMGDNTNQARMANNLQKAAEEAYMSSLHMSRASGLPLMSSPPYLPLIEVEE